MIIKVCGINDALNYKNVAMSKIDMIGLNFYPRSKRYVIDSHLVDDTIDKKMKVGVFVNETIDKIKYINDLYQLDYIQCHGGETVDQCQAIQKFQKVIKVFSVATKDDLEATKAFDFCDLLLFDTATKSYGGSGVKFDWGALDNYNGQIPFLLAGGLSPEDALEINKITHPQFYGVDLNSKFETRPGYKDIQKLNKFIKELNRN